MSTPPEVPVSAPATGPEATTPGAVRCPRCGAEVGPDQDWCLNCGAPARTRLAPSPGWKAPIAALAVVAVLLGAGLAAGFVALTKDPAPAAQQPAAAAPAATTATPAAPATSTPAPAASTPAATTPPAAGAVPTATTPGTIVPGVPTTASVPTIGTVPVPTTAAPSAGAGGSAAPGG